MCCNSRTWIFSNMSNDFFDRECLIRMKFVKTTCKMMKLLNFTLCWTKLNICFTDDDGYIQVKQTTTRFFCQGQYICTYLTIQTGFVIQ